MTMFKPFFKLMSPAGEGARLSVLIFHRVLAEPDPLFPSEMHAKRFDVLCGWLSTWFNVLPLDAAVARLKTGDLPERAASITFDDGYADNFHLAMPILVRHRLTATFFIATSFLDGGCMWNDVVIESIRTCKATELDLSSLGLGRHSFLSTTERRSAIDAVLECIKYLPSNQRLTLVKKVAQLAQVQPSKTLMMTSQEVRNLRLSGMQIGAHTESHPILAKLTDSAARQEILASKQFLESLLGERVSLFAYPNGKPSADYTPQTVEVVRSLGFDAAVSTHWGASRRSDDIFQIRRFTPWDQSQLRFGVRLLMNLRGS